VVVAAGELGDGLQRQTVEQVPVPITVVNRPGASVMLKQLDLTGVGAVTFSAVAPTQYKAVGGKVEVRIDSVTGPLLGETGLVQPRADPSPQALRTALRPTSGVHDLYLVFRGPTDAKGDQFMFGLLTATFEPARP
jgi:cytochrome c